MEPGNGTAAAIDANHPLGDIDHPAWRVREQLRREAYAAGAGAVSEQMVGAVEALLELGDDGALRAGMTMLCETWRTQQARQGWPATVDAKRAQSAAELLDQFLTALDSWATQGGWSRVYSAAELRWFAERWLPAGEIPAGLPQPMLDAMEDARCTTTQAAIAHIDALTRERP